MRPEPQEDRGEQQSPEIRRYATKITGGFGGRNSRDTEEKCRQDGRYHRALGETPRSPASAEWVVWLSGKDLNLDQSLQRALCYHYTTGQAGGTLPLNQNGATK